VLHTEGRQFILDVAIRQTQTVPAAYYLGWCTEAALDENASLADLTELAATNGYARIAINSDAVDWTSATYSTNGRKATSKVCTFLAAGGNWSAAGRWFLATASDSTGKLIASGALNGGAGVTLLDTKSYDVTVEIRLVITSGWVLAGLQYLLEVAFTEQQSVPASFYRGLGTNTSLADGATLASIAELSGDGYARDALASDGIDWDGEGIGVGDYQAVSKESTFSAAGADWVRARIDFLATTVDGTGKLLGWRPVQEGSGYILPDGENYDSVTNLLLTG
jgi:hypothetical protein